MNSHNIRFSYNPLKWYQDDIMETKYYGAFLFFALSPFVHAEKPVLDVQSQVAGISGICDKRECPESVTSNQPTPVRKREVPDWNATEPDNCYGNICIKAGDNKLPKLNEKVDKASRIRLSDPYSADGMEKNSGQNSIEFTVE